MSYDIGSGSTGALGPSASDMKVDCDAWSEFNLRWPSVHRRHGDPYPLPRHGKPSAAEPLTRRLDGAVGALNSLASAFFDKTFDPELPLTKVQTWMMGDLKRRIANYGDRPQGLDEEQALRDLGCGANLYMQEASHADLNANEIKIFSRQLEPISAVELAPPDLRACLEDFRSTVERPVQELEALRTDRELVEPYWDPSLKNDRDARFGLYVRLQQSGLLTVRRRQKARMGLFAVKKKGNKVGNTQRLIVDCRQANSLQRRPPTSRLSTPASLASLDFNSEVLEDNGFETDNIAPEIETGDVGDCFYNFCLPAACSWFSTGDITTREELRTWGIDFNQIYDEALGQETPLLEGEPVYLCFAGVPMGWSWALHIAQEIVSYQCQLAVGGTSCEMVRDKHLAPPIAPLKAPMGVCVDNVHTFGGQRGDTTQRMDRIAAHFKKLNIPFEVDYVAGHATLDTLGLTFDLSDGVRVRGRSDRVWRLWAASRAILRRRRVSGATLRKWLGHVNYHFLLCRPMLSVLSATYKFCIAHLHHRFPMWPSVRKEIKLVMNLLFVVEKHLSVKVNPEVHVGDSSDKGYGLMYCKTDVRRIREELKYQERWRFLASNEPSSVHFNNGAPDDSEGAEDDSFFAGTTASAGLGLDTGFGKQLVATLSDKQQQRKICRRKHCLFGKPSDGDTTFIAVPGIPEVSPVWGDPTLWTLITAKAWERVEEHINIKEARVALMALRRLCRSMDNMDTMALTLTDSMVTAMALERGRSSSSGINNVCRRAAAYQIGCNIQFRLRHVRTDMNVADAPSRQFGEDLPRVLRRVVPEDSLGVSIHADSMEQCRQPASSSRPGRREGTGENQQFFLELFSGCGNLTKAVKEVGLLTMPPFDILNGDIYNLLNPGIQDFIMGLLISGNIWWVHLGTPCTVWSRARRNIRNFKRARQKERQGIAFALFSCRVIRECLKRNIAFTLENPKTSRLWQFSPLAELMKDRRVGMLEWDMCQYGESYKKSTCLMTNELGFQSLARRCQGGHKHVHLQGTTRVKIDGVWKSKNRTSLAGAYPMKLCRQWARIAEELGPPRSRGRVGWRLKNDFIAAISEANSGVDKSSPPTSKTATGQDGNSEEGVNFETTQEAIDFLRNNPVIFGHFTKQQIVRELGKLQAGQCKEG